VGLYSDQPLYEYRRNVPPSRATDRAAATRSNPAGITPEEVRSHLDGRVPQWAVPRAIEFVAAIPLTAVETVTARPRKISLDARGPPKHRDTKTDQKLVVDPISGDWWSP
jgi:hypothetical protein